MIQLGITFFDEHGNTPHPITTWQFNFRFNLGYVQLHAVFRFGDPFAAVIVIILIFRSVVN